MFMIIKKWLYDSFFKSISWSLVLEPLPDICWEKLIWKKLFKKYITKRNAEPSEDKNYTFGNNQKIKISPN